jgi:hypothetical protein
MILFVELNHLKTKVAVLCQVFLLSLLPYDSKVFNSLQSKAALLLSEFTILPESVKADDKSSELCNEWLFFNLRPYSLFSKEGLSCLFLFFLNSLGLLVPLTLLLLELLDCLLITVIVQDRLIKSFFGEA